MDGKEVWEIVKYIVLPILAILLLYLFAAASSNS